MFFNVNYKLTCSVQWLEYLLSIQEIAGQFPGESYNNF